jgi:hypothetical protein
MAAIRRTNAMAIIIKSRIQFLFKRADLRKFIPAFRSFVFTKERALQLTDIFVFAERIMTLPCPVPSLDCIKFALFP